MLMSRGPQLIVCRNMGEVSESYIEPRAAFCPTQASHLAVIENEHAEASHVIKDHQKSSTVYFAKILTFIE